MPGDLGEKGENKRGKLVNKREKLVNEERTVGHAWKLRKENVTQRGQRMKQPDREKNCEVSGENLKGRPGVSKKRLEKMGEARKETFYEKVF